MKTLKAYKASDLTNDKPVDDIAIEFVIPIQSVKYTNLKDNNDLMYNEALWIAEVLKTTQPQGIRYKLAMLLLMDIADSNLYHGV